MLKGIPKLLSPELLKILCEMGHGDEIVIGDANFPAETCGKRVVRADGISGTALLEAILQVFPLDTVSDKNYFLMNIGPNDEYPTIWNEYEEIAKKAEGSNLHIEKIERFAFYERAKQAFAVVASGEEKTYANIILKKGVIK